MPKHKAKKYHAIANGHISGVITDSWAIGDALTNDVPKKDHRGFQTFKGAEDYLKQSGYHPSEITCMILGEKDFEKEPRSFYGVANGIVEGVYATYSGAEPQVHGKSRSCYKTFHSSEEAMGFIKQYRTTREFVQASDPSTGLSLQMLKLGLSTESSRAA